MKNKRPGEVLEAPATGLTPSKDLDHAKGYFAIYTKRSSALHRGIPQATSADPVVCIAHQIQRLWDAHRGSEVEEFDAREKGAESHAEIQSERRIQIFEWLNALETVGPAQ